MSQRAPYRRRATRRRRMAIDLTPRDVELLTLVGLTGYCSTAQLAREFFPTEDRCRRRIRALFDAGLVSVTLASSTKPNLLSLSRPGLALLRSHRPELDGRVHLAGAVRLAGVDHHLAVVDARLYAASLPGATLLEWSNAGGEVRKRLGLSELHLVPDGIAQFEHVVVAVEVDCASQARSVIASKLARYDEAFRLRLLDGAWFVVVDAAERQAGIATMVVERGLADRVRVVDHAQLLHRPVVDVVGFVELRREHRGLS